jgi:hypothetical protein
MSLLDAIDAITNFNGNFYITSRDIKLVCKNCGWNIESDSNPNLDTLIHFAEKHYLKCLEKI